MKPEHKVFQIFYDAITRENNDKGFLQLDNFANQRPDWAEYWPIRNYLLNNKLEDHTYYGFFSPKFLEKTGLHSDQVFEFLNNSTEDLIVFSPFFDFATLLLNIFDQHPKNIAYEEIFKILNSEVNINNLVMTSRNTIYCNFFAAKKEVWAIWLNYCEKIFTLCDSNSNQLADHLNSDIYHPGRNMQCKVFVIERIISFLLVFNRHWTIKIFDPLKLPFINNNNLKFSNELLELDALKIAFNESQNFDYIRLFSEKRTQLLKRIQT